MKARVFPESTEEPSTTQAAKTTQAPETTQEPETTQGPETTMSPQTPVITTEAPELDDQEIDISLSIPTCDGTTCSLECTGENLLPRPDQQGFSHVIESLMELAGES